MKRLIALVVAIALIVAASVVRRALDDDDGAAGDADGRAETVVCAIELRRACMALGRDFVLEDAAVTADRLTETDEPVDAWIVFAPWPDIVDAARERAGRPARFSAIEGVARSALVAVVPTALGGCDWRCLGSGEHDLGGRLLDSGLGLLHLGAAANGFFGRTDYARNDFDNAFRSWLSTLTEVIDEQHDPVTQLLLSGAFFDAALSFEAEAVAALDRASADRKADLTLLYPEPVTFLDVVIADVDGAADEVTDELSGALLETGWGPPGDAPTGLPSVGVLTALRGEIEGA